jgi:outer membrane protein insertion porin family
MRSRFSQFVVLAIAQVMLCRTPTHAQTAPHLADVPRSRLCLPVPASDDQPYGPEVTVAELTFDGDLQLGLEEQEKIASSVRRQRYSRGLDEATSEVLERVSAGWQDQGYFKVEVRGDARVLNTSPISQRVAVTVHVDEGRQYRLEKITFKNNRAITDNKALRSLFPITDGDIVDREKIVKGLESLRKAYDQLGYINFTPVPDTQVDEDRQTIALEVDVDEGKQFFISSIRVLGLNQQASQNALTDLLLKPGDIYNQRLLELFLQKLGFMMPGDSPQPNLVQRRLDQRLATVAITFDFRRCPINSGL